jgi:membrane-bound ClpP family serine protease
MRIHSPIFWALLLNVAFWGFVFGFYFPGSEHCL